MQIPASVLAIAGLVLSTGIARAEGPRGHAFSAWDFGQARAETSCPQQESCFETAFQDLGDLTAWASCYNQNLDAPRCVADFRGGQFFALDYGTGFIPVGCTGDCFPGYTAISVQGTKDGNVFMLDGSAIVTLGGRMELAVLKYTGNPTALAGVVVNGVQELVSQGIVRPDEILYSASFEQPGQTPISERINVTGIGVGAIVIYGYGEGPPPPGDEVPAASPVGLTVLVLLLLAASGFVVRARAS
jgi:hypothetical protein